MRSSDLSKCPWRWTSMWDAQSLACGWGCTASCTIVGILAARLVLRLLRDHFSPFLLEHSVWMWNRVRVVTFHREPQMDLADLAWSNPLSQSTRWASKQTQGPADGHGGQGWQGRTPEIYVVLHGAKVGGLPQPWSPGAETCSVGEV